MAAPVQKVTRSDWSLMKCNNPSAPRWAIELLISKAARDGPTARARLAVDCVTPNTTPCCAAPTLFDAKLVSAGVASELPIENTPPPISKPANPPAAGPTNGTANKLIAKQSAPTITRKGIGINFDAYQVGPYAAGPQFVLVPYSTLKDVINPEGPVGQFAK